MVYCSAVDCKSDSSRKNEQQNISFFKKENGQAHSKELICRKKIT